MVELDANCWGPKYWFFLHTLAMSYPIKANDVIKKKYYELIKNMHYFIPIERMGNDFSKLIDQYPVSPYLDSRDSFIRWVHFIHNKINEKLEKPKITLEQFYRNYYELYKPNDLKMREFYKLKSKIIYTGGILLISGLIYYFYNK